MSYSNLWGFTPITSQTEKKICIFQQADYKEKMHVNSLRAVFSQQLMAQVILRKKSEASIMWYYVSKRFPPFRLSALS